MSEMVDRIAHALLISDRKSENQGDVSEYWKAQACAAIDAMRDPSESMLEKFEHLLDTQGHQQSLLDSWRILIDEAVKND